MESRRRPPTLSLQVLVIVSAVVWAGLSGGCGATDSTTSASTDREAGSGPTEAVLQSVGTSGVSGKVVYVKQSSGLPLLKVRLEGLERASGDKQYFLWQLESRQDMVNLATYNVPSGGRLSVNIEPNPASLSLLEQGSTTEILITKIHNNDRYYDEMERHPSARTPAFIGVPVARGSFTGSLVGVSNSD